MAESTIHRVAVEGNIADFTGESFDEALRNGPGGPIQITEELHPVVPGGEPIMRVSTKVSYALPPLSVPRDESEQILYGPWKVKFTHGTQRTEIPDLRPIMKTWHSGSQFVDIFDYIHTTAIPDQLRDRYNQETPTDVWWIIICWSVNSERFEVRHKWAPGVMDVNFREHIILNHRYNNLLLPTLDDITAGHDITIEIVMAEPTEFPSD